MGLKLKVARRRVMGFVGLSKVGFESCLLMLCYVFVDGYIEAISSRPRFLTICVRYSLQSFIQSSIISLLLSTCLTQTVKHRDAFPR
jgi:hypothetical protein